MAAYCQVYAVIHFTSPAGWLPVHRDQLQAQCSVTSMGKLYLFTWNPHYNKDKFLLERIQHCFTRIFPTSDHYHMKPGYVSWDCGPWKKEKTELTWSSYLNWRRDCLPLLGHIFFKKAEDTSTRGQLGNWRRCTVTAIHVCTSFPRGSSIDGRNVTRGCWRSVHKLFQESTRGKTYTANGLL